MPETPSRTAASERLRAVWRAIESGAPGQHTSVIVPSLSFDRDELAKILGIQYYEERFLLALLRLRDPRARIVYVSSQPIHPDIVSYYLDLLPGSMRGEAARRLAMVSVHDPSPRPLTEKILERPRLIERLRGLIADPEAAYLTCFNTTELEGRLSVELGIPLNGTDPTLSWIGTKSGSRRIFEEASVPAGFGLTGIRTRAEVVQALEAIAARVPDLRRAVVKLDDSFAGAGNAVFRYPADLPGESAERRTILDRALGGLEPASGESPQSFLAKLERMGGIVEEFIEASADEALASPSVQLRIDPDGRLELLSSHEQVLGGPIGQTYVGCRFPADECHRATIQEQALRVGQVLASYGVVGRFGIDFLVVGGGAGGRAKTFAVEINLRMGGTTFPLMALSGLVPGALEPTSGLYQAEGARDKRYFATDNLRSPSYTGLCPEDLLEIIRRHGLLFDPETQTGPVFYMIGALSEFGRVGVACIADSAEAAEAMYRGVVGTLDAECPGEGARWRPPRHPLGTPISRME